MQAITFLLERLRGLRPPNDELKQTLIKVVREQAKIELKPEQIKIRGAAIYLEVSPALKSALFIKKSKIQAALHATLPQDRHKFL